jgi:dipeptidyl aminopeptidase/acylaminoacyl peptidase
VKVLQRPSAFLVLNGLAATLLLTPSAGAAAGPDRQADRAGPQATAPAHAPGRRPLPVDELIDRQLLPLDKPQLHWFPDSRRLLVELPQGDFTSRLVVYDTAGGTPRDLGTGTAAIPSPAGDSVGYLGDDGQVWLVGADGNGRRSVTHAPEPVWSFTFAGPDAIVYTTVVQTPPPPLPTVPGAAVTQIGAYPTPATHFFLQPLGDGAADPRPLGSAPGFVYGAMTYVPSRQEVVYPLDSDLRSDATAPAEVHAISTRTGATRTVVARTGGQWLIPTVLPDEDRVAFPMAAVDTGYPTYQDVGLASLDGGPPRRLTTGPMQTGDLMAPLPGDRIAFRCKDSTYTRVCVTPTGAPTAPAAPAKTLVARPDREVNTLAGSADGTRLAWVTSDNLGRTALEIASSAAPAAITTIPLPGPPQPSVSMGAVREVAWTSDGIRLTGLVITPPGYRPGHRYPAVVDLHGGPAGGVSIRYGGSLLLGGPMEWQLWASRGYVVFVPDYRESGMYGWGPIADGRGKDFLQRDVDDVLRGIDMLVGQRLIDPERMALVGHSYGALLGNFMLTRVHRFRAAVLHEGVADLLLPNIVQAPGKGWAEWQQGGPPWEPRAQRVYLRNEALLSAGDYRTPTLFLTGEYALGSETLIYSWKYMYTSLHRRGIDTQLLVYGGEGHVFLGQANRRDTAVRSLDWITGRVWADGGSPMSDAGPTATMADAQPTAPPPGPARCAAVRRWTLTAPAAGSWRDHGPCRLDP